MGGRVLGHRIEFAVSIGALRDESEEGALLIKKVGDNAAHFIPGLEPDMEKLLEAMTCVLEALHAYLTGAQGAR